MQLVLVIVVIGLVGCLGIRLAEQQRRDVFAVDDAIGGRLATGELCEGRQQVHRRGKFVTDRIGGNFARLPDDGRHSKRTFAGRVAASVQRQIRAAGQIAGSRIDRRAVVGCPDHQRVLGDPEFDQVDRASRPSTNRVLRSNRPTVRCCFCL